MKTNKSLLLLLQASQEVSVLHVSTSIIVAISAGLTKTTKKLIWEHVGRPIHSVVHHMPKESCLKKCKYSNNVSEKNCAMRKQSDFLSLTNLRIMCSMFVNWWNGNAQTLNHYVVAIINSPFANTNISNHHVCQC